MAWIDQDPGEEKLYWTDGWSGYRRPATGSWRRSAKPRVSNPVILSGDVHAFGWANLRSKTGQPRGRWSRRS
jgi:alkaline phosphatase D